MEFSLKSNQNFYPCEVLIDHDNCRYTVRKNDSTGEYFNSPEELALWIIENWDGSDFYDQAEYYAMMKHLQKYLPIR
jgi:hypothetical protein